MGNDSKSKIDNRLFSVRRKQVVSNFGFINFSIVSDLGISKFGFPARRILPLMNAG